MFSIFLLAILVDVINELARDGVLSKLMHADGLALMSETMEGLRSKLKKMERKFQEQGCDS